MSNSFLNVLCPTDLSPMGDLAVAVAYDVVKPSGVVHLLHVQEPAYVPSPFDGTVIQTYYPDPDEQAALDRKTVERLQKLVPATAAAKGVRTEVVALRDPSVLGQVLAEAKKRHVDAIVMGTRGRSGLGRLLMGSVATAVLKEATVPVLLIHEPHAKA